MVFAPLLPFKTPSSRSFPPPPFFSSPFFFPRATPFESAFLSKEKEKLTAEIDFPLPLS